MIAAFASLCLAAPPSSAVSGYADLRDQRTTEAPAVILWDNPKRAGETGEFATIWTPIVDGSMPHQSDLEAAVVMDMIEQAKLGDDVVAVVGGHSDHSEGGIAGTEPSIVLTLIQAPSSVVVPAQASLERVVAYLTSILSDRVTVRIGIAFRSTGAPNILGVTASRWAPQQVPPSLASMIRAGTAQGQPDDARFLPQPPPPFGTGPSSNSRMRVMYTPPQASNRPRYASEDRIYWTYPQLKAAWQYPLVASTAYDAQISINTNAAIFQNLDFDPRNGVPAGKYSFEDLVIRQIVQALGWTCALSINLRQEMSVMDMYRFSADRVSLTSASDAPDTGSGYMIQPTGAYFTLTGCSSDCGDLQLATDASVAATTPYVDPNLGDYRIDLNPGIVRPLRFDAVPPAFDTYAEQADFVADFLPPPPAGSGFGANKFGWAVRQQFGGAGIWDDAQLTPPPPPSLRTPYTDGYQQQFRTRDIGTNGAARFQRADPLNPALERSWRALDTGVDGSIRAFALYGDDGTGEPMLHAGGTFLSAGGTATSNVARWTGTQWEPLGTGLSGTVNALAVFDDELYAGGAFRFAGTTRVNYIARWDGVSWSPVGQGVNNAVNAFAVFDGALYVGGDFTSVDGSIPAQRIARWSSGTWSSVGAASSDPEVRGLNGPVLALVAISDRLYVGGRFSTADNAPLPVLSNIASWDGTAWSALGSGTNAQVRCLASFDPTGTDPRLVAGGDFTLAGDVTAGRIASWNQAAGAWTALGSGANGSVFALAEFDDGSTVTLGAGGDFTTLDGATVNYVGEWNGSDEWSELNGGLLCSVNALAQQGTGDLWAPVAGGSFTGSYCVLVDFRDQFPGYMPRLVAAGLGDGLVNLNFVTGNDDDPTNEGPDGVDLEVPILSNQAAFTSFLVQVAGPTQIQYLMGGQQLPQATTYYSRTGVVGAPCNPTGDFLSPTELKILNCLGWAVNPVPTAADCE